MVQTRVRDIGVDSSDANLVAILPYAIDCTVLTPSGTVLAHGRAGPREEGHLDQAYSVRLVEVEPAGVLEAMVYSEQPNIILRTELAAELPLRIDHITGAPSHREFFCHLSS